MHTMQSLLRQPLHAGLVLVRPSCQRSFISSSPAKKLSLFVQNPASRESSICLRCQFRTQSRFFSSKQEKDSLPKSSQQLKESRQAPGEKDFPSAVTGDNQRDAQLVSQKSNFPVEDTNTPEDSLPSETEKRRSQLSKRFTEFMDTIQSNAFIAGQKLNDLTGYSGIEKLKQDIEIQESLVLEARSIVRQAKDAYSAAINRRSTSQREVNELLQRKNAWSAEDVERFTSLYRSDHANEVAESEAEEFLTKAEHELEEVTTKLNRSILSRYHEEQIWSDKIRRMSTWGTWGLMGVNVLLFFVFQVLVEPWRRRRLVKGFEEKVKEAIETEIAASRAMVAGHTKAIETGAIAASVPPADKSVPDQTTGDITLEYDSSIAVASSAAADEAPITVVFKERTLSEQLSTLFSPIYWNHAVQDRFSDRRIVLTQREVTNIAIQSATVGATIIGITFAIFRLS